MPGDAAITDYTWTFNDGNPPVMAMLLIIIYSTMDRKHFGFDPVLNK
ncbi:MAG: hypothetical protein IPL24_00990 [Bacteroidetes bacterium]|nr:hypothetical protein [Bacteroidota bacterium]